MIEILARLPVKSLLRFKSVRKSWYALVKNPNFISKHLNCATSKACVSFVSKNEVEVELSHGLSMPFFYEDKDSVYNISFCCPCNGIICVVVSRLRSRQYDDLLALWNPATREFKHLLDSNVSATRLITRFGLGFHAKSNDYKVVKINDQSRRDLLNSITSKDQFVVEVYRASTDSWRELDVLPKMRINYFFSTYLNGFHYWCVRDDNGQFQFVLSFDFADEVFENIPLPDVSYRDVVGLATLNETITFANNRKDELFLNCVELWVLNIYSGCEKKTWTKFYKISSECSRILGFLRDGEALIAVKKDCDAHGAFTLYDPNTKQLKNLTVYNHSFCASPMYSFQMVNYVESLVSFKGAYVLHPTC